MRIIFWRSSLTCNWVKFHRLFAITGTISPAGDVGTVMPSWASGVQNRIKTLYGETVAVTSLQAAQVRPIGSREVAHVRST
jgi:hypothetical protein